MDNFRINDPDNPRPPAPDATPSLSARLGVDGHVVFLHQKNFWIATEDNEPETITVWVAVKHKPVVHDVPHSKYVPLFGELSQTF